MTSLHHRQPTRQRHTEQIEDTLSFGAWLRQRRRTLDLTQAELAQRVNCARITIRRIEADELKPSQQLAELFADHLGIPPTQRKSWLQFARGRAPQPPATIDLTIQPPALAQAPNGLPVAATLPPFLQQAAPLDMPPRLFVAREPELAQLQRRLDLACAGQGRVAFVTGEAGSGKSSLVQEFARRAQREHPGLVVATGSCQAFAGIGDPYLPFRELLALLTGDVEARWGAGAISRDHANRLWSLLPQVVQTLLSHSPDLIDTFIPGTALLQRVQMAAPAGAAWVTPLATRVGAQATAHSSSLQQQDLFAQTTRLLLGIARQQPLLLLLEDLQWADSGSLHLLFHLGRQLAGSHILLLGLYRPTDVALGRPTFISEPTSPASTERHLLTTVVAELQRTFGENAIDLQQADGHTFVQALLATMPHRLPATFPATLYRHTEGQALFTVELLRAMQARGDLVQDGQGDWLEGPTLHWETLPAQIEGMIGERIGRLPLPLQTLLTIAAVEGDIFSAELIATVQGVDEKSVIHQLSSVLDKQHGLVCVEDVQRLPAGRLSRYRFRHHLFQKYLYQRLDVAERASLHEAVGQALAQRYGELSTEVAPQLARHFELAGLPDIAITYLFNAGEQARRRYVNPVAIEYFTQALTQLQSLPTGYALNERATTVASRRFVITVSLGKAYYAASKLAEAESCFREAIAIGHDQRLSTATLACLYYWLAETLFWQHRYAEQLAAGEAGLRSLGDTNTSREAALMNYTIAKAHRWLGNRAQAEQFIMRNQPMLDTLPYAEELGEPYLQIAQLYARDRQDLATGQQWIETLRHQATHAHDWRMLARSYQLNATEVLEYSGDLLGAAQELRQAIHYFAKIGDSKYEMNCLSRLAWTLIRLGQLAAAEACLLDASQKAEQLGNIHGFYWGYANWGLIQLCRGDWQAAEANLDKTMAVVQNRRKSAADRVWVHLLWARLYLLRGDQAAARWRLDAVNALADQALMHQLTELDAPDTLRLLATIEEAYGPSALMRHATHQSQSETPRIPTLVRYYLASTQPALGFALLAFGFGPGQSDKPKAKSQDDEWAWCDPFGDCRYRLAEGITIWAANGRELYGHNRSAPRLLQPVSGDFAAQTRCCAVSEVQPAIGGLLLWRDEQNYLCLNQGLLGPPEISFRGALAGEPVIIGRGRLSAARAYLRLERRGLWVDALCSADGSAWFTVGQAEFPFADPLQIGLYAVGDIDRWFYPGAYPDGTAIRFAEFALYKRE